MGGAGSGRPHSKAPCARYVVAYLRSAMFNTKNLRCALPVVCRGVSLAYMMALYLVLRSFPTCELPVPENKYCRIGAANYSYAQAVHGSYTHTPFKAHDISVLAMQKINVFMRKHEYLAKERVGVISMCVIARDSAFCEAALKVLKAKQPSVPELPVLIACELGTLHAASIIPVKRSALHNEYIAKNYDLASWNVGKCTGDLINICYTLSLSFDCRERLYTEQLHDIAAKTSAKNLLYNHLLLTFRELDLITLDPKHLADHGYTGNNSTAFKRLMGGTYDDFAVEVQNQLKALAETGSPSVKRAVSEILPHITGISINISSCQFLKTLQNYAYPSTLTNWRGEEKLVFKKKSMQIWNQTKRRVRKTIRKTIQERGACRV